MMAGQDGWTGWLDRPQHDPEDLQVSTGCPILSLPVIFAVHHCGFGCSAVAWAKQAIIIKFLPAFEAPDQI
jgi:hypothetical protein